MDSLQGAAVLAGTGIVGVGHGEEDIYKIQGHSRD